LECSYTVLFKPAEEGGYVAFCPALPGLVTEGDTYEQVRARVKEAIEGTSKAFKKTASQSQPIRNSPWIR
jgi:antitoxin HicB